MALRVLELFSGLGGWRVALGDRGAVAAAYDISPHANAAYLLNHGEAARVRELATVGTAELAALGADTWLMSPPCQPFCRTGNHEGLDDPRSRAYLNLLRVLDEAPPARLALENVEGFLGSEAERRLTARLERHGLRWRSFRLDPLPFGLPNQRPRAFLAASRDPLPELPLPALEPRPVGDFLDAVEDESLYVRPEVLARHYQGLDLVDAASRRSACFIGGYGRRYVGSGSFLKTPKGVRRFSPAEAARLLGLPEGFRFPEGMGLEARYKLLGNGLSIPVARWVLGHLAG